MMRTAFLFLIATVLVGCGSSGGPYVEGNPNARLYTLKQDRGPSSGVNLDHVANAVPRAEPKSRGGNKSPYRVLGKTYHVMPSAVGYKKRGTASWYGKKFHGHKTSNGETYDMYAMSAAHKSVPLPTYLRVTNLDNGRHVIVRANDRGPFHGNRLIDLSYAAAYKLDMLKKGTARVEVEAITPGRGGVAVTPAPAAIAAAPAIVTPAKVAASQVSVPPGRYFQLGAFSTRQAAVNVQRDAGGIVPEMAVRVVPVTIAGNQLYRVQVGPIQSGYPVENTLDLLQRAGYNGVRIVDFN